MNIAAYAVLTADPEDDELSSCADPPTSAGTGDNRCLRLSHLMPAKMAMVREETIIGETKTARHTCALKFQRERETSVAVMCKVLINRHGKTWPSNVAGRAAMAASGSIGLGGPLDLAETILSKNSHGATMSMPKHCMEMPENHGL